MYKLHDWCVVLAFKIQGSGFGHGVQGSEFRVQGLGSGVWGSGVTGTMKRAG